MKKFLRLILVFWIFVLTLALSTVTALACSPDDNNPEHHENVIQTDEEKPTCLQGGYYVLECTVCRWSCAFSIGDIVPHEFGPWEIVPGKEPTCTKAGEKRAYCSTCNKWYPELVPATGHSWYKYYTKEPACTTAGEYYTYCRNCPASQGRSTEPATGHFWVVWKRVFATCTTPGYTEFVCDDCGADGGTTTTPAKGHSFGEWFTTTQATCMEEGMQKRECTTCGATESRGSPKTDHSWDAGTVIVQPTAKREGVMEWRCSVCDMTRTKPIPTLTQGPPDAPIPGSTDSPPPDTAASTPPDTAADKDKTGSAPGGEQDNKDGKNDNINEPGSDTGKTFGDKGSKSDFGKNSIAQNALQKQEKDSSSKEPSARSFSVVKVLLLVLVPVLLVTAGIILLLVRRKKTGQP